MQAGGMKGWLDVREQKQEILCAGAGSNSAGFIFLCDGFLERAGPRTKAQAVTTAAGGSKTTAREQLRRHNAREERRDQQEDQQHVHGEREGRRTGVVGRDQVM